jgi:hypothetical protein
VRDTEQHTSGVRRTVSLSVVAGTILVPLSAVAALLLTGSPATDAAAVSTTSSVASAVPPQDATGTTEDGGGDLKAACGPEGMGLVALEQSGGITAVQQAALDALREICEQEGIPLPGRPAPEPVTETVLVADDSSGSSTAPPSTVPGFEDDDHEDEEDHEDDEDQEDQEDHGDEDDGHQAEEEHD